MTKHRIPQRLPTTLFERAWSAAPDSMAGVLVVSLSGRLAEERLARAVRLTLNAEPILGCRFVEHWYRPSWRRYEDLDSLEVFEIRASSDRQADLQDFLEAPPEFPVEILLLRAESDMLCIKLDHLVGDGMALQEYAYLLADIYNRLEDDPGYHPVPNLTGSRSLLQVGEGFGLRDKWRILRHTVKTHRESKSFGQWKFSRPEDGRWEFDHVGWRLDIDQVDAIFEYGYRQRATVSHVLLSALYLAVREALPCSTDLPLSVGMAVDLRRFLPSRRASALCNLAGVSVIGIDPRSGSSLDSVVEQIRDQMKSQRRYLGLAASFFAFEAVPVIRQLMRLVPYGLSRRSHRRRQASLLAKDHVKGWVLLTNVGELDPDRLVFRGAPIADAYATAGVHRIPGLLGLGVSSFRGSLTLRLGSGPAELITGVRDRMMETLATSSRISSRA